MKRIGILTAGGDTPALNATIRGAVECANQHKVEVFGFLRGYAGLLDEDAPHVRLNPLFTTIPELDPCYGGTILGSSRTYVDHKSDCLPDIEGTLRKLGIEGLICIGGDGTINGMQPISEFMPCVLAPKTIDNDLGLNYMAEANEYTRTEIGGEEVTILNRTHEKIRQEEMINYATPGYATAVFVVAQSIQRIRTTAESHRRVVIIEVMGRQSGYIALGSAYGQPDIILVPEEPLNLDTLERRVRELYDLQRHVVIVAGEGVVGTDGKPLGDIAQSYDPAGNVQYAGAAEALKRILEERIESKFFESRRPHEPAKSAIFTRKVGHTQRGGRPVLFDRFHATQLGGNATNLLLDRENNSISTLQWSERQGFFVDNIAANKLRDQWGEIHPRTLHESLYDEENYCVSEFGIQYLQPIFRDAVGYDDVEYMRTALFNRKNLTSSYESVNVDVSKRVRRLSDLK
ncbi:MAG: 6-phosphofructokinase [Planctomycetaceae bacterium]